MKLDVKGIEEIEITDPAGLCNPPVPQLPAPQPGRPAAPQLQPVCPGIPISPDFTPGVKVPHKPLIYTNKPIYQSGPAIPKAASDIENLSIRERGTVGKEKEE